MWTRRAQAAVSVLVLMTVWTTSLGSALHCDTTKVGKLQASDLTGNAFLRLINLPNVTNSYQAGYKLSVREISGKEYLKVQGFFLISGTCTSKSWECVVKDTYCEYPNGFKTYVIFHNEDYDVMFSTPDNTVEIYSRYIGGFGLDVEHLPQDILNTIAYKCDNEAITNAFYTQRLDAWSTVPTCD